VPGARAAAWAFLVTLMLCAWPAAAKSGRIVSVVDGDTVVLAAPIDGASAIRLVGIQAPKLPLGRKGFVKWPLADAAKAALEAMVLGQTVELVFGGRAMDRHGRLLAHLYGADGGWVQGQLISAGMARVYSFPDNRAGVGDMLALEAEARAAGRGLWGDPFYAVRGVNGLVPLIGTFQLVEGRVLDAATVGGRTYLNFGADWRSDFTVGIDKAALPLFQETAIDPLALKGAWVRVRGWLKNRNGPMIEASHPEQIESLGHRP